MGKGSKNERRLRDHYQTARYATFRPMKSTNYGQGDNDVWGQFDVMALSPFDPCVHAVQVKTNGMSGITAWARRTWLFRAHGFDTLFAGRYDREGWRLERVLTNSAGEIHRETLVDERTDDRITSHRGTDMGIGDGIVEYLCQRNGIGGEP